MAILRMKHLEKSSDKAALIDRCIQTVDGLEKAHINLATGEITYSSDDCVDEDLLREALGKEGVELEKVR